MKKLVNFRILFVLALSVVAYSCDNDENVIDDSKVLKSDADAYTLVNGVYPPLQGISSSYSFLLESASEGTISFEGAEDEAGPVVSRFETEPGTWYPIKIFSRLYQSIGAANDAIERIEAVGNDVVSEAVKKITIGRAKFIRGVNYLYLVQLFGEVPLVLQTTGQTTTRASIDVVYAQIVKDLTEAETVLPLDESNKANPSKGAANAILARAYLVWGHNPLTQTQLGAIASGIADPAPTVNADRLQKAVDYANAVINSGKYSLETDLEKNYGRNNKNGQEQIFVIRHELVNGDGGNHQSHCAFTEVFQTEKDVHIGPADIDLYNNWDAADKRREFSYTSHLKNPAENDKEYTFLPPVTLPRFGKGIDRTYTNSVNLSSYERDMDRIEIRYAEVLLTKAEALLELDQTEGALPLVNQIRERAYGDDLHNLTALTREALYKEWEHEFVYDQKRWLDLVRWKTLITTVKSVENFTHYINKTEETTTGGPAVNQDFFNKVYDHLHAKYNNVKGKHYRFPIPLGEQSEELGITPQNPGY
ncbi:RagB/SusD family nutrient uptake outer membrane protein [termite gut metagenome]|uniref:RagB/SusD family nutrient uptake outer membrane protein n=1 Tax=termite gut metagenome TaxID=433724 RepID=A0A5J4RPG9_9ZZZZ